MERAKLNFPDITLRCKEGSSPDSASLQVWDELRHIYIVLTPEEWVRRHVVGFLKDHLRVPPTQILVEFPVRLNGQMQRADVVVVGGDLAPRLLVECKASEVKLSQSTLDQVVRYNSIVGAKYVMLTNGLSHHIYERLDSSGGYKPLKNLPEDLL
ncbi:MAG: type I restriction enzyme HsdR N-terminal domain-containing protein [Rikenellaceae bacterium]